jgi:Uncharacterised nucleotidyltransferase
MNGATRLRGLTIAATLKGAWHENPSAPTISASELDTITPLLLQSGSGALSWRRIRNSPFAFTESGTQLQQAYRLHALQASLHEINIQQILASLKRSGIESILVKGWAIARYYPESGLRPYGDIDLCVSPADYDSARAVLLQANDRFPVDLHKGMALLDDREWNEVYARSDLETLGGIAVRVPAAEDHFRLLCFHLLRHGVERPIGLCDIAVLLESQSDNFDWKICFGSNATHASWIRCVIGLAKELLGADVSRLPFHTGDNQPAWIVKSILKAWGKSFSNHFTRAPAFSFYLKHPQGIGRALAARWPPPIIGTVGVGGSFNRLPRFPYQLGYLLLRSGRFLKRGS